MKLLLISIALTILPNFQSQQGCSGMPESYAVWCNDGEVSNGYWWNNNWVPYMVDEKTWRTPAPTYSYGRAVWYAQGVMEANVWLRYEWGQMDGVPSDYLDGVALMSPSDIGKIAWLRRPGFGWEGPFIVVDCAQWDDIWPIVVYRKEVVEVGWDTKQRWGITEPLNGVEVIVTASSDPYLLWLALEWSDPSGPAYYPDWWLSILPPR